LFPIGQKTLYYDWHDQRKVGDSRHEASFPRSSEFRRCLIPADGFYEWQRRGNSKLPFCFEVNNGGLFAFAGLWDGWKYSSGRWVKTCSILTTNPNAVTSAIHDRMPVILDPNSYNLWLDPVVQNVAAISELLKPSSPVFGSLFIRFTSLFANPDSTLHSKRIVTMTVTLNSTGDQFGGGYSFAVLDPTGRAIMTGSGTVAAQLMTHPLLP
jgi:hypothetical protein